LGVGGGGGGSGGNGGRDRERTEKSIVLAVGRVIAARGFHGLGVNSVAREAGVDKVLIYRYFGGMEELIAAYAQELDFWPSADEIAGFDRAALRRLPLDERMTRIIVNLVRAVYRRPLTPEILAWRLVEQNELTRHLDESRIRVTEELYGEFVSAEEAAAFPHLLSTVRLVGNGALYMVVGARNRAVVSEPEVTGNLDSEEGWVVLESIVSRLFSGVFGGLGADGVAGPA
jgi:AcrR family transcriptional regulator